MRRRICQWITRRMLTEVEIGRRDFEVGHLVSAGVHMQAAAWLGLAVVAIAPRPPAKD